MRVEILKPVVFRGEIKRSGTIEVPDLTAQHWIKNGAARDAGSLPPVSTDPLTAAKPSGTKKGL